MRHPPSDPWSRRRRGAAFAAAVALHAGVITVLLLAKLPDRRQPEPVVYDLVFVASPAPAAPVSEAAVQATPAPAAKPQPAPAPVQTVVPLPPPERPVINKLRPPVPLSIPRVAEAPAPSQAAASSATPAPTVSSISAAVVNVPTAAPHPPADPAYAAALLGRLGRYKEYPLVARERGLQGRVILRLAVARSGHVEATSVELSSGAAILDQAALKMVHRADPLPPLPSSFPDKVAEFRVPVDFALALQ